jgi:hypothetical protein
MMRDIEEILLELRAALEPLESGRMQTGKRYLNGPWIDTTQDNIRRLKQAIAKYEVGLLCEEETSQPQPPGRSSTRPKTVSRPRKSQRILSAPSTHFSLDAQPKDHIRKLRIRNIFGEAVEKAEAFREGVNVRLGGAAEIDGVVRAQVTVVSQNAKFKLRFIIGANDDIAASGPKGAIRCSLTVDSIEGAIKEEIQRELGPKAL